MGTRRVILLASAALLTLAVTASTASATVLDADGNPYTGVLSASTASTTIGAVTCAGTFTGTVDGDNNTGTLPAPGGVTFQNCSQSATVTATGLPDTFTVTATTVAIDDAMSFHIDRSSFTCTASGTANTVVGNVDWSADTITLNETLDMSGLGCGTTTPWTGVYTLDQDLDWG